MIKCYYLSKDLDEKGNRIPCEKDAYPDNYFCTRTHQLAWQKEHYDETVERPKRSIQQMQARLKEMAKEARKQHAV